MTREIKFRQPRLNIHETFIDWFYWGFISGGFIAPPKHNLPNYQYTGLHDKNDREIYEGDILLIPNPPTESNPMGEPDMGVVKFIGGAFGWQYLDYKRCPSGNFETFISWAGEIDILHEESIIGNIYENPELIKEVK